MRKQKPSVIAFIALILTLWLSFPCQGADSSVSIPKTLHFTTIPKPYVGLCSWYSVESAQREGTSGVWTASGERYSNDGLTCAFRSRDWGGRYKVTNLANGKSVTVRHNDFGPGNGPTRKGIVMDLSPRAFETIADKTQGLVKASIQRLS